MRIRLENGSILPESRIEFHDVPVDDAVIEAPVLVCFFDCPIKRPVLIKKNIGARVNFYNCPHVPKITWWDSIIIGLMSILNPNADWKPRVVPLYKIVD